MLIQFDSQRKREFCDDAKVKAMVRDKEGYMVEETFGIFAWRESKDNYEYQLKNLLTDAVVERSKWFKETELDHA